MSIPGYRIYQIRNELGLSQEEFALRVDAKTKIVVYNWGKDLNFPNTEQLIRISEISDKSIDFILTRKEESTMPRK